MVKSLMGLIAFLLVIAGAILPTWAAEVPPVVVGRVTDIEADLLRYVPEESDWVAAVRDVPFAEGDTFYSGGRGRAELMVPNGSRIRMGSATQLQFLALEPDYSEADVAAGLARFYNDGPDGVIKVNCPFGYVLSYPGSAFDVYVGENSAEVVSIRGTVSFVHDGTNARYEASDNLPSILADPAQVAFGEGVFDPEWSDWNETRDRFWATRAQPRGESTRYLPPPLWSDAYLLEENGRWDRVIYEGRECRVWRPDRVDAGWAPFTVGRWTEWYGDQTWIPAEPFGYVTHHYGNWILVNGRWYWAPPVARPGLPLLQVDFVWYPGRVSWIHNTGHVGWVPLAPRETYYSRHRWGGSHAVVVAGIDIGRLRIDLRRHAYAGHAVVVPRSSFYGVNDYRRVRVRGVTSTVIVNNYRAAPVVTNTVIADYSRLKQRHSYANVAVNEKPHASVVNRIQQNDRRIRQGGRENPAVVRQEAQRVRQGNVNREAQVQPPRITNYVVPSRDANRPKSEVTFRQHEVGTGPRAGGPRPDREGRSEPGQRGRSEGATPVPSQGPRPQQQPVRPEAGPSRPGQPEGRFEQDRSGPTPGRPQGGPAPAQPPQAAPSAPGPRMSPPAVQSPPQPQDMRPTRPDRDGRSEPGQRGRPEGVAPAPSQTPPSMQQQPMRPDAGPRPGGFEQRRSAPQGGPAPAQPPQAAPPAPGPQRSAPAVQPPPQAAPAPPRQQPQDMRPARPDRDGRSEPGQRGRPEGVAPAPSQTPPSMQQQPMRPDAGPRPGGFEQRRSAPPGRPQGSPPPAQPPQAAPPAPGPRMSPPAVQPPPQATRPAPGPQRSAPAVQAPPQAAPPSPAPGTVAPPGPGQGGPSVQQQQRPGQPGEGRQGDGQRRGQKDREREEQEKQEKQR